MSQAQDSSRLLPVTRRTILGTAAATPALGFSGTLADAPATPDKPTRQAITVVLEVNGRPQNLTLDSRTTLLDTLREHLGLTEVILVPETDRIVNPLGIKGIGELGNVGMNAAVANAVFHATGIRVREIPVRLENLLV
jgi:hypothetical protein